MMLGDKVSASEAEKIGMIYKVFSSENFEEEVQKLSGKMAQMPTKALGFIKQLLNETIINSLEEQLELESKLQIESAQSKDYSEGVNAFVEKRKPKFIGR